jgi:hypothetical protein
LVLLLLVAGGALQSGCGDDKGGTGGGGGGAGSGGAGGGGSSDGGPPCRTADDCRLYDSYCDDGTSCHCLALRKDEVDPPCIKGHVSCIVAPCLSYVAACENSACVAKMK